MIDDVKRREEDASGESPTTFVLEEARARPQEEEPQRPTEVLPSPVAEEETVSPELDPIAALEAILFVAEDPISDGRLAEAIGIAKGRIPDLVGALNARYDAGGHAVRVRSLAGGFAISTQSEFGAVLRRLYPEPRRPRLSAAALETLAIIAYRQPIVRAELDAIRGVHCGGVLSTLLERDLISVVGRADGVGRPLLYGTTRRFLELFGLPALSDLPRLTELGEMLGEGRDPAQTALSFDEAE
jgi:segregation and condensation protein B